MLSERERRALELIEQAMAAEAPDLAGSLTRMAPDQRWSRRRYDAVVLLCALSAVLTIALGAAGAGMTALLFGAIVLAIRCRLFPPHSRRWPAEWRPSD